MAGFFRKKKEEEKEQETRTRRSLSLPGQMRSPDIESREYRLFKKKEDIPLTWFERLAGIAG